jgi:hypothetical protein
MGEGSERAVGEICGATSFPRRCPAKGLAYRSHTRHLFYYSPAW